MNQRVYPYGFSESDATNLLTAGAFDGEDFQIPSGANRAILQVAATDMNAVYTLEIYDGSSYSILVRLTPGVEAVATVPAGVTVRLTCAATAAAAMKYYHLQFRRQP